MRHMVNPVRHIVVVPILTLAAGCVAVALDTGSPTDNGSYTGGTATDTGAAASPLADSPLADCVAVGFRDLQPLDGTVDEQITLHHDGDGRIVLREVDGAVDSVTTWTYDGQGHELVVETDADADGVVDGVSVKTWSGDLLQSCERDDATGHELATYTYGPAGELLVREVDEGADGTIDWRYTYSYGPAGELEQIDGDEALDGTIDWQQTYTRPGSNGGDTRREDDLDGDGVTDLVVEEAWDGDQLVFLWQDGSPPDGAADIVATYVYNPDGTFASSETATAMGGTWATLYLSSTYAPPGFVATSDQLFDLDGDGVYGPGDLGYATTWAWTCPP